MPILIVNSLEQPQGLVLGDRALIGRRPFNTITIPDPEVSRIHAWIGRRGEGYVLFDAGSRGGTLVNRQPVQISRRLVDGDEIRIGPATLVYRDDDHLPDDVAPIDNPPPPPAADPYDGGIYFDCMCGGPMWVNAQYAGKVGKCRYCGERLIVPHVSGQTARRPDPPTEPRKPSPRSDADRRPSVASPSPSRPTAPPEFSPSPAAPRRAAPPEYRPKPPPPPPAPPPPPTVAVAAATAPPEEQSQAEPRQETALCSICQTPILATEERTACPSCHLTFHAQCWAENYGCSAYGCDQVNVLAPAGALAAASAPDAAPAAPPEDGAPMPAYDDSGLPAPVGFPWEPVLLALSFVAMALGALAFGIPSAVMLVGVVAFLLLKKPQRKSLVVGALVVAIVGGVAGYATSMFWWKGVRVWETIRK